MKDKPLVSVLMTSYNREDYIAEAIESVLSSSYTNFELIIVDDGSMDDTVKIASKYKEKDSRVLVYVNETNLGDYANRNKASSYAKGKYLKYLDSDDAIKPWGLEYCVTEMEKNPEAALGISYYGDKKQESSELLSTTVAVDRHFRMNGFLVIGPSGTIIKREAFVANKGFDTRFGVASDCFFNLKIASNFPILLLKRDFFFYRVHPGQEKNNKLGYLINNYNHLKELLDARIVPLEENQLRYHRNKLDKRLSVNVVKYFAKNPSIKTLREVMRRTNYNTSKFLAAFFK